MGDALLPGIAVADVGKIARAVFAGGTAFAGRRVSVAGEHLSGVQIAAALSEAFGESVRYVDLPLESLRAWGFMGEDGANTLLYKQLFNAEYCASRPVAATRDLVPDLLDFAGWLKQNGSAIPR
jgi:uncharacterized protein YbjT (DUF2867 family)